MAKQDYKKVFDELPHVTEIWVVENGDYFLVPHYGGERITIDSIPEDPEADTEADTEKQKRPYNKRNG